MAGRRTQSPLEDPRRRGLCRRSDQGRQAFLNDYDKAKKEHLVRAISHRRRKRTCGGGAAVEIRPSHGITRTVPAVGATLVFSLDPKCRFHALDAKTGKLVWQKNLVQEYKATIPGWYAGQNPLLDGDRVLLATGGDALVVAFDQATGKEMSGGRRTWQRT